MGHADAAYSGGIFSTPWQLTADKISNFDNPPQVLSEGNVVMIRVNGQGNGSPEPPGASILKIQGDWVKFDNQSQQVSIKGHAVLESEDELITADSADLDLLNHTGFLQNVTLYFPHRNLYLEGREVEKTGELSYTLVDGWVTRCEPQEGVAPPWSFGWSKGSLTYGGFAHFTHATLRVKDVPVMYSPYFAFSTNIHRKTGLLLPEWSQGGRDGTGLLVPLFLNLSPSHDMTLYAGGLAKRGVVSGAEFRYVQDYMSKGTMAVNYLNDRLDDNASQDYKSDGIYRTAKDRYWFRGKIDHDFGVMLGKLDLDIVSDQDYLSEFDDGLIGFSESEEKFKKTFSRGFQSETTSVRSNTAQLYKGWSDMALNGETRIVNDPSSTRSTQHLWTLPRVAFSGRKSLFKKDTSASNKYVIGRDIDVVWDSEYANLWRENGVGSQRLDLHPQLKTPLRISPYLETTATLGVRETFYSVDDNSGIKQGYKNGIISRTLYDFDISTSTIFMRHFPLTDSSAKSFTHMIRPSISYTYVPPKDQRNLPDLEPIDRIEAVNSIKYGVRNDFDLAGVSAFSGGKKIAFFEFNQSYDIREDRKDLAALERRQPFSDLVIDSGLSPYESLSFAYKTSLNMYGRGMTGYQASTNYSNTRGDGLDLEYRYEADQNINQLNFRMTYNFTEMLFVQGIYDHSFFADNVSDASLRVHYNPACWSLDVLASTTDDDDYRFTVVVNLEGIGKIFGLNQTMNAGQ